MAWTRLLAAAAWLSCLNGFSDQGAPSEYEVKAACVYNFPKFVEWPPRAFADESTPFVIGVIGDDPFNGALETAVKSKDVRGRPFVVRHLKNRSEAKSCQILFVSQSEKRSMPEILAAVSDKPVLTVGETDRFLQAGGIVSFFVEQNKVRFEINAAAAKRAGLKISSKLLSLARRSSHSEGTP